MAASFLLLFPFLLVFVSFVVCKSFLFFSFKCFRSDRFLSSLFPLCSNLQHLVKFFVINLFSNFWSVVLITFCVVDDAFLFFFFFWILQRMGIISYLLLFNFFLRCGCRISFFFFFGILQRMGIIPDLLHLLRNKMCSFNVLMLLE